MILQTGMRTDIPAFYSDWFMNRIRQGYVCVRNPMYPEKVTRFDINPETVDLINFCTKNPEPMFKYLDELKPYGQYWFVTCTAYGTDVEPFVPPMAEQIHALQYLSDRLGPNCVGWRYDPIFFNDTYTPDVHIKTFELLCQYFEGYTHRCIFSFLDLYEKVKRNFPEGLRPSDDEQDALIQAFSSIASNHGIKLVGCHESPRLEKFGVETNGCLNQTVYEEALGKKLKLPYKKSQRDCNCFFGTDIGAYDTCAHGCKYCYANTNRYNVIQNMQKHDPNSPFLIGGPRPDDIVCKANQKSYIII